MIGTSCTEGPAEEPGWDITGEMVVRKAEEGTVAATSGTSGMQAEGQGRGIRLTTVNRQDDPGNDEENMVTPEKNAGVQWGYGFSNAEWQKAGNGVMTNLR